MVAVSSGKTYTKIAPPANHNRFAPSTGSAFHTMSPRDGPLRLDPGLRHLQGTLNTFSMFLIFLPRVVEYIVCSAAARLLPFCAF